MQNSKNCPGCQAAVSEIDGPTHLYLGASAGCWKIFCDVLAKEFGDPAYIKGHRLMVDTYAIQHPGVEERRTIQSVNVHLLSLYLVLEKKLSYSFATQAMGKIIEEKRNDFKWLTPPKNLGELTIMDVARAETPEQHIKVVKDWARKTWQAWGRAPSHN